MEIFECTNDLRDVEYESLPRVLDGVHIPDLGQQLSSLEKFSQQILAVIILEGLMKLHDEGRRFRPRLVRFGLRELEEYVPLALDVFNLLRLGDLIFPDDLQGIVVVVVQEFYKTHLSEIPLPQSVNHFEFFNGKLFSLM